MFYRLNLEQENELLNQPETGMGYQIIEASLRGKYIRGKYLVLNSEVVIEMNASINTNIRKVINEGIASIKAEAKLIEFNSITVLDEIQLRYLVNESKSESDKGAIENPLENANGVEVFVRLSAFEDDKRIDKIQKRLRDGSYTTTLDDYKFCKVEEKNPVERYALPNEDRIKYSFYIQPKNIDTLQRGIVQPANEKTGGGKEVYFHHGTSEDTFINQQYY